MAKRNVGTVDRIVRTLLGVTLLWVGLRPFAAGRLRIGRVAALLVGAVLGVTALAAR